MANLTEDDKHLIELVFVRTVFEKDIGRAQAMLRLGYSRPAIVNRTHIPRPILGRLSWERKWKVDHQARLQKVAYEKELRARYRTKGKLSKRVVNEIRVRAGINTIQRREQIPDVSHEFTKKELAEWMRRIKPNNIPAMPDIEPFYAHKTPGTKQVLLQLVGKGKTIAASFAALGFHLSVWKNWLKEDPDFELPLSGITIPGRDNPAHTTRIEERLASWSLAT